jgi:hypothetical protein
MQNKSIEQLLLNFLHFAYCEVCNRICQTTNLSPPEQNYRD